MRRSLHLALPAAFPAALLAVAAAPGRAAAQPIGGDAPVALAPTAPQPPQPDAVSCGRSAPGAVGGTRGPGAPPRPPRAVRGYLGLRLSEWSETRWTDDGVAVRYCAYPLVVSVEPASPAERAGLGAGDTLLAYGARDLVRDGPIALDRLLVPGETLRVRVRRDGRTFVRPVVVGERAPATVLTFGRMGPMAPQPPAAPLPPGTPPGWPAASGPARPRVERRWEVRVTESDSARPAAPGAGDAAVRFRVYARDRARAERAAAAERRLLEPFGPEGITGDALVHDVLERARAGDAPLVTYLRALPPLREPSHFAYGPAALAGAQLVALGDDLRDAVAGAPARGVFVLQVLPGTPAADAGLRAGDVIVAASGRPVETPAALQRALALGARAAASAPRPDGRPDGRTLALRVARGGASRDVVLRW